MFIVVFSFLGRNLVYVWSLPEFSTKEIKNESTGHTDGFSEAANLGRRFWAGVPRSPGRCSSEATEEAQPTGRA